MSSFVFIKNAVSVLANLCYAGICIEVFPAVEFTGKLMGLAPILVQEIFDIIHSLNESGTTVLLVEQNASMALSIADRAYVLETGMVSKTGPAIELLHDDDVRKAYLGN